ncbi:GNAT family N-acetyltransferase [Geodermatophilus ruber]|nr:GNAT family N-acetyltransferase [Geodermatophilus ruber]
MAVTDAVTSGLHWVREDDPRWDADRQRVFAAVPDGVFPTVARRPGERLSSDWWRAERDGRVVGYGWLDDVWGDAEILLAVEEGERGAGVGAFVLGRLEEEAAARGLNYVLNVVREGHPERAAVTAWFERHGFAATEDGRLRKQVGSRGRDVGQHQDGRPGTGRAQPPDGTRQARYAAERERAAARPHDTPAGAADAEPMGPGHEESGGYVDVERHRF